MSYDVRCYELAQEFLSDEPTINTEPNRHELAQNIQDTIETLLEDWRTQAVGDTGGPRP